MNPLQRRQRKLIFLLLCCVCLQDGHAQTLQQTDRSKHSEAKQLNFYVFTRDAGAKVDFFGGTAIFRARIKSYLSEGRFRVVVATNTQQVVTDIISQLEKTGGSIGTLWIDCHGLYKKGYSSFHIGRDEYSYKNINDSGYTKTLALLQPYCDSNTHIGIGSCYGGATYYFPGSATVPYGRMNGDSLMMGVGRLFTRSVIYGSESWVMAKPGIFNDNYGFAGYPLGKKYRSRYWQPVWERLGQWNRYRHSTGIFEPVNTVALTPEGYITIRQRHYQGLNKGQKALARNLSRLAD
jgi:hypothetical protein